MLELRFCLLFIYLFFIWFLFVGSQTRWRAVAGRLVETEVIQRRRWPTQS